MIGSLTLDQLRVLVAIEEAGSFSGAGRKLGRVQSAISQTVATLEDAQGVILFDRTGFRPTLTEVGRALIGEARTVLSSAARFEALAAGTREGLEPHLAVAIDPFVPTSLLIDSLHALRAEFPFLPISFSTEGLGGSQKRLRSGDAAIGICMLIPSVPDDLEALPLLSIDFVPVVSPAHPLASLGRPATRSDLDQHVQLVLSDPSNQGEAGCGAFNPRAWRFAEDSRRIDFLLAGFGWCRMPYDLVAPHIAQQRLIPLTLSDEPTRKIGPLTIYVVHRRDHPLRKAGRWLLEDLRSRFG